MHNFIKAGYVPLPAWLIITTIAGFFAIDYNPIASHVSVMTLQPGLAHMMANTAAWLAGVSLFIFALGIWKISGRVFSAGALCWSLFGIAMISNGIWPMGEEMHGFYILGIFNIVAPALSLLDLKNSALREKLYGITAFVSLMGVLYLWIILNGFDPEGYSGLTQRIFGSINFFWPLAFAGTYLRTLKTA